MSAKLQRPKHDVVDVTTVIVGGGIAGLGCARTLADAGHRNFVVISPELLGRIPHSPDGEVNYGVYYAREDYEHVLPYLTLTRKLDYIHGEFFNRRFHRSFFDLRNLRHLPSLIRFYSIAKRQYRAYLRFKRRSLEISQRQAILEEPELYEYFVMNARDAVKKFGLEYWDRYFFDHIVRFTSFLRSKDASAALYGGCLLPLFVPTYEFRFELERLIEPFFDAIVKDRVTNVKHADNRYHVQTAHGQHYRAHHLVIATPMNITKELVEISEPTNEPISVYLFHLRGELHEQYKGRDINFLANEEKDIFLSTEDNNTHIIYTKAASPNFDQYFARYDIISERHWKPAFFMGKHFVEADRGNNLYVIGDHNISSMEDSYVTGIYAAKRIGSQLVVQSKAGREL